jgi:hypothetical protein
MPCHTTGGERTNSNKSAGADSRTANATSPKLLEQFLDLFSAAEAALPLASAIAADILSKVQSKSEGGTGASTQPIAVRIRDEESVFTLPAQTQSTRASETRTQTQTPTINGDGSGSSGGDVGGKGSSNPRQGGYSSTSTSTSSTSTRKKGLGGGYTVLPDPLFSEFQTGIDFKHSPAPVDDTARCLGVGMILHWRSTVGSHACLSEVSTCVVQ